MTTLTTAATLDGRPITATTTIGRTGAHICALETILQTADVELHSTYLGHPRMHTHATHLLIADEIHARTTSATHHPDTIGVCAARQRCLLDHYAVLVAELRDAGLELRLQVDDHHLDTIEQVS